MKVYTGNPQFLLHFSQLFLINSLLTPLGKGFSFDDIGLLVGLGLGILALVTGLGDVLGSSPSVSPFFAISEIFYFIYQIFK